jgi:hypothetical protein
VSAKRDPAEIINAIRSILDQGLEPLAFRRAVAMAVLTDGEREAVGRVQEASADEGTPEELAEIQRVVSRLVANSGFRAPELLWHTVNDIANVALRQQEIAAAMAAVIGEVAP